MRTTIAAPFINQEASEKGEKLDRTLEDHAAAIEIWKTKVSDNYDKNQATYLRFNQLKIPKQRLSMRKGSIRKAPAKTEAREEENVDNRPTLRMEMKKQMKAREGILCRLIEKRESKFKRVPGTQLLQRNDVKSRVKNYLGLRQGSRSMHCKLNSTQAYKQSVMTEVGEGQPEWEQIDYDEDTYQMMCKN